MENLSFQFKLWIINEKNEAVFGDGLARLLEEIDTYHSILKAAKKVGMSYRYALHRITLAEERLDKPLVNRVRGGAKGGGFSEVTEFGRCMVANYRKVQKKIIETTNHSSKD